MKKVAIFTINDYNNYGNRLQNYATQEVIRSLGFEVETIVNPRCKNNFSGTNNVKYKLQKLMNKSNKEKYESIKTKIRSLINKKSQYKRIAAFKEFTAKNIIESDWFISNNNIPEELSIRYDFFITGSDQVWNPLLGFGSSIDFLIFAPQNKRISYAPSFGIETVPDEWLGNFKVWLTQMSNLSVREEAGAKIIKELTGREALVLVDPTLMFSKEKWLSISKPAINKPENAYLSTYFLGHVSKVNQKRIKQIAMDNKLELVNLANIKDKARFVADPGEFIDYINSSSLFLTDSFHGAIFSILLEKPFITFDRVGKTPSMNSRIDTLLSKFNLQHRKLENIKNNDDIFNVDYSKIPPILETERNKALNYLKNALNVKADI